MAALQHRGKNHKKKILKKALTVCVDFHDMKNMEGMSDLMLQPHQCMTEVI